MPPPANSQLSASRRRGRPPKTPTKGPPQKQAKVTDANSLTGAHLAVFPSNDDAQVASAKIGVSKAF